MKAKFFLISGVILIIASGLSLIFYYRMEIENHGFHANDFLSWILLCIGVGQLSYFVGRNIKN